VPVSFKAAELRYEPSDLPSALPLPSPFFQRYPLKVIDQARRRVLEGEQVPTPEKIYSIFEPHTDLIKRGKVRTPVEFGHKAEAWADLQAGRPLLATHSRRRGDRRVAACPGEPWEISLAHATPGAAAL
jgi:hypothetical protein